MPQREYDSTLTVTATDSVGNSATASQSVLVDTETSVSIDAGLVGGDDMANASERAAGITLTGQAEAGASVAVTLEGVTHTVTAGSDGTWATTYSSSEIPQGTYDATVSVTATDAAGNSATTTGTLQIDTETDVTVDVDGDMFATGANAAQFQAGIVLEGTTEPFATVVSTVEGVERIATADAAGNWAVTYEEGSLPEGTYTASATMTVPDLAGNSASTATTFLIDTEIVYPVVDAVTFSDDNVKTLSLSTEDDQDHTITALNTDGSSGELSTTEFSLGAHQTFVALTPSASDGTHLVVSSTDAVGNQSDALLVLDDNMTNAGTLDHTALAGFNIEGIELDYASDTSLTLTETQVRELSDTSDSLTIHGVSDDQVTLENATKTSQTVDIEGEAYDVYTVGDDGVTLIIDQDIDVVI